MELLTNILQVPFLQALGVVITIGIAERVGIPVVSTIKTVLKINGNKQVSELDKKMDVLTEHFNHSTTDSLERIERAEEKEHEANEKVRETLTSIDRTLYELREYGVKIRK